MDCMKKAGMIGLMLVVLLSLPMLARAQTPAISLGDVYMARDSEGLEASKIYGPRDTFYAYVGLEDFSPETELSAVWLVSNVANIRPDLEIGRFSIALEEGINYVAFNLAPESGWPTGRYRVELYIDDAPEILRTLHFVVIGPSAGLAENDGVVNDFGAAYMSAGAGGERISTGYGVEDSFYVFVFPHDTSPAYTYRAIWYAEDVEGQPANSEVGDFKLEAPEGITYVSFSYVPTSTWPIGVYRVDIYANDAPEPVFQINFRVD